MATLLAPRTRLAGPDLARLGPNWYAAVMGTAIVANGAAALPVDVPGRTGFAQAVWALSALLLVVLVGARAVHLRRHRAEARRQLLDDPATAVFYGCPPMALLAVGFGTLSIGAPLIGAGPALGADLVLWSVGTLYAVAVAIGIPLLMITRHRLSVLAANPTWLLPVVAPMVAASLGPALVPHLPAGGARVALLYGCYALFGASLLATLLILPLVFAGLVHGKLPALVLTPTLFLVLGPLGQSTTAVNQLADAARTAAPALAGPATAFAVLYGVAVMGFAMLWLALALAANLRALKAEMPFAMTWWAFTFPVGTLVTGAAALSRHTGFGGFTGLAAGLYVLLLGAWAVAAVRTAAGVVGGRLL
ncbi:TDT family transporter [Kitasatospora paracochleata]|uniref:C4-dicarboxylate transporter/malic acid transport protein n=1 Tax=Kitasatospora paracochleata TaxID=58354 RepID=A0ABT1J6L3_9ACTN|nr:TDT family transporter [Kitasatospora paracochleata]MCP2313071.1 C4-dicarboxylate transporter/malic acid transport protein [Kitasatospora paracochleata]